MNPSNNETSGLNLPPPVAEQGPIPLPAAPESLGPEQIAAPAAPEQAINSTQPVIAATQPVSTGVAAPSAQPTALTNDVATTTQGVVQDATEDKDLIDKETVDMAKAIIERNRDDPHKQTEELTELKAEHIYKTYNKQIKTKQSE